MEGTKVYIPDPGHIWLPAKVIQVESSKYEVHVEDVPNHNGNKYITLGKLVGQKRQIDLADTKIKQTILARTVNTDQSTLTLPLQNPSRHADGVEDMITLDYLHEGAILYNLRHRFYGQNPYTYTGKICIAVNPYQWLNLYSTTTMTKYTEGRTDQQPHVYATSMDAFLHMRKYGRNQSLLVSGESGAGKTETTKILMGHIAKLSFGSDKDNSDVINKIIEANPLLESFGNAKTVRNDNSSRFGKFTELQFDGKGALIGARSRTYLLEKSRVTKQSDGERNFHIFYQLLAVSSNEFPEFNLGSQYRYVNPDDTVSTEDMAKRYHHTADALGIIGIDKPLQKQMMSTLAAILHLGEVHFEAPGGDVDKSQLVDTKEFGIAADLLGVSVEDLEKSICNRNVVVGREVYLKPNTVEKAIDCRDALSKALFSKLFDWLVVQINNKIGVNDNKVSNFVGILDIFGFEHFKVNSFEQLCINYANEKLQQKFVQDILKTVQAEYEEEGISWSHINFDDNQDVLDVIEGRLGVLSLLNEESLLATGTDAAFAHKLATVMEENKLIETPRLNHTAFTIHHYAGTVTYSTEGFLDKHRDALLLDIKSTMAKSKLDIVAKMFYVPPPPKSKKRHAGPNSSMMTATVGTQFKNSLAELMIKISDTEVHYVRCIKPNSKKSPHIFEHSSVVGQLRCAGVIEAIRVSRSAYPNRVSHRDCLLNYAVLLPGGVKNMEVYRNIDDTKSACEKMMTSLLPGQNIADYQVGLTRIYFREGVLETLESKRAEALKDRAIVIQKTVRGYTHRKRFIRVKSSITTVQKTVRCFYHRRRFLKMKRGVTKLQARVRGARGRKDARELQLFHYASLIQATGKSFVKRRQYLRMRRAIIILQSFWRMGIARLRYTRRLSAYKKHQALDSKVARLQTKLGGSSTNVTAPKGPGSPITSRQSIGTTKVLFNESAEVLGALQEENERMRLELEKLKEDNSALKTENRKLREWQKSKEVDERVKTMAQRDQEAKDLAYLAALEKEFDKLRLFMCQTYKLPLDSGSPPADRRLQQQQEADAESPSKPVSNNPVPPKLVTQQSELIPLDVTESPETEQIRQASLALLTRAGTRLARAKTKTGKGSARRVKDYWEEIRNFPPPMQYSLGSVPWKRLLTDWAQGNPKKLDYMTRWLKNVLEGGTIENGPYPMGVELKSVTPMMLDGFMQLIIPKLNERGDINVHVHTKEFIGTSMRITLSVKEGVPPMKPRVVSSPNSGPRLSQAQQNLLNRASGSTNPQQASPHGSPTDPYEGWDRSSIRSAR